MKHPKIFLFAPISDQKGYCLEEWLTQITNFSYPNYQIYLVDNSKDPEYHKDLAKRYNIEIDYVQPIGQALEYITASQNRCRDKFLESDCDYAFSLECDQFVPLNIMEYFMLYQLQLHNIIYLVRKMDDTTFCLQNETALIGEKIVIRGMLQDFLMGFYFLDGTVRELGRFQLGRFQSCCATGIGCTMIRRDVLEKIKFRIDMNKKVVFSDTFFHEDARKNGIRNYLDTRFTVRHERSSWIANLDYNA